MLHLNAVILNFPWKSRSFAYGVVFFILGFIGFALHVSRAIPELTEYQGAVLKVENFQAKSSGVDVFISVDGEEKRFNLNRCRVAISKISNGDNIIVRVEDPFIISRVDGSVWFVKKSGVVLCDYAQRYKQKSDSTFLYWIYAFFIIFGSISAFFGYRKKVKELH